MEMNLVSLNVTSPKKSVCLNSQCETSNCLCLEPGGFRAGVSKVKRSLVARTVPAKACLVVTLHPISSSLAMLRMNMNFGGLPVSLTKLIPYHSDPASSCYHQIAQILFIYSFTIYPTLLNIYQMLTLC